MQVPENLISQHSQVQIYLVSQNRRLKPFLTDYPFKVIQTYDVILRNNSRKIKFRLKFYYYCPAS